MGSYWSPWRDSVACINGMVQQRPGIELKELVQLVPHHWASAASAKNSIAQQQIACSVISGLRLRNRLLNRKRVYEKITRRDRTQVVIDETKASPELVRAIKKAVDHLLQGAHYWRDGVPAPSRQWQPLYEHLQTSKSTPRRALRCRPAPWSRAFTPVPAGVSGSCSCAWSAPTTPSAGYRHGRCKTAPG